MSTSSPDFLPAPREDNAAIAHQMAAYSQVMEKEIIVARNMTAEARIRLAALLDKVSMLGTPSERTLGGVPIIEEKGFPGAFGEGAIAERMKMRIVEAHNENVWETMVQTGAHYRAALGRYDHFRDINEWTKYNLVDMTCLKFKDRTFAGECPDIVPDNLIWPDKVAITNLLKASHQAAAEAYRSYPGRYSAPAFALLQAAGIIETEVL